MATVGDGEYQLSKLNAWTGNIVVRAHLALACGPLLTHAQEGVLKRLGALSRPLKYIGA